MIAQTTSGKVYPVKTKTLSEGDSVGFVYNKKLKDQNVKELSSNELTDNSSITKRNSNDQRSPKNNGVHINFSVKNPVKENKPINVHKNLFRN